MYSKKGQVTIFVVLGIVLLAAFLLIFFLRGQLFGVEVDVDATGGDKFVRTCFANVGQDAVSKISLNGGFLYNYDTILEVNDYTIAYHLFNGADTSPSRDFMESELTNFVLEELSTCIERNASSASVETIIDSEEVRFIANFEEEDYFIRVKYPLGFLFEQSESLVNDLIQVRTLTSGFVDFDIHLKVLPYNAESNIYTLEFEDAEFNFAEKQEIADETFLDFQRDFVYSSNSNSLEAMFIGYNVGKIGTQSILLIGKQGGIITPNTPVINLEYGPIAYYVYQGNKESMTKEYMELEIADYIMSGLYATMDQVDNDFVITVDIQEDQILIYTNYGDLELDNTLTSPLGKILAARDELVNELAIDTESLIDLEDSDIEATAFMHDANTTIYRLIVETDTGPYSFDFAVN